MFTGARQTGKTTLARALFPEYAFLSIEDPVLRGSYARLTAAQWRSLYPTAILDEVQKEPSLIESVKSVYDQWPEPRYLLLGSSQLLLLDKVRESLAGRCTIVELYPLTLPELKTQSWSQPIVASVFQRLLVDPGNIAAMLALLSPSLLLAPDHAATLKAWDHYRSFGGYPALVDPTLDDDDRHAWLSQYVKTYLERDVRDLATFRDLEPFIQLQRHMANQTATILNLAGTAKALGISSKTVQRYVRYLELSYQMLVLPAWSRNAQKRLVKSPKIHFLDYGVLQAVVGKRGSPTGFEFESMIVSEAYKQAKAIRSDARFHYLRTVDGREVDLLVEIPEGYIAFEIKSAGKVNSSNARHLVHLDQYLDKPLIHAFVLSNDPETRELLPGITALHVASFLA